jgi:hypothetical protein
MYHLCDSVTFCRLPPFPYHRTYSGRKITELGKRHSKRGKKMERAWGSTMAKSLSMYSITENIYYSQLSSVTILLQPEPVFTSYSTMKGLCSLCLCAFALRSSPPSHVSTCNGQRSSQLFCVHYTQSRSGRQLRLLLHRSKVLRQLYYVLYLRLREEDASLPALCERKLHGFGVSSHTARGKAWHVAHVHVHAGRSGRTHEAGNCEQNWNLWNEAHEATHVNAHAERTNPRGGKLRTELEFIKLGCPC